MFNKLTPRKPLPGRGDRSLSGRESAPLRHPLQLPMIHSQTDSKRCGQRIASNDPRRKKNHVNVN